MQGICFLADDQLASEERLCAMELELSKNPTHYMWELCVCLLSLQLRVGRNLLISKAHGNTICDLKSVIKRYSAVEFGYCMCSSQLCVLIVRTNFELVSHTVGGTYNCHFHRVNKTQQKW